MAVPALSQSGEGQGDTRTPRAPSPHPCQGFWGMSTGMSRTGAKGRAERGAKANAGSTNLGVQLLPAPGRGEGALPSQNPGDKGQSEEGSWGERGLASAWLRLVLRAAFQGFKTLPKKDLLRQIAPPAAARVSGAALMGCRQRICPVQEPQLLSLQLQCSARELRLQEPGDEGKEKGSTAGALRAQVLREGRCPSLQGTGCQLLAVCLLPQLGHRRVVKDVLAPSHGARPAPSTSCSIHG